MEVSKADLELANLAIKQLQDEVEKWKVTVRIYAGLNHTLMEHWESAQVQIERLKARLSEFEV